MKKLLFSLAIILPCYALQAQSLDINNNVIGDVYVRVYTVTPNTCTLLPEFVDVMVTPGSSGPINLSNPANWNGSTIPTSPYEFSYAEVFRDPMCPGTAGWGAFAGTGGCSFNNMYYDQVTVGNAGCSFNTQACLEIWISGSSCGAWAAGDVVGVQYTTTGTAVTIDVLP